MYDPFIERALEPWSFGIYAGGQSILVGTPSGVTLAPEGGAHQSIKTPSIGLEQPDCPACGQSIRQGMGPVFAAWNKWLGDQWSIGDWPGLQRALLHELPPVLLRGLAAMMGPGDGALAGLGARNEPRSGTTAAAD
jgi:hypothetical protein